MDGFQIEVDADALVQALLSLGDTAQTYVNEADRITAEAVANEARSRLKRQLAGTAVATTSRPDLGQGLTLAGIIAEPAHDGNGYVVSDGRDPYPNLPLWIEKGTKRHDAGSHTAAARPFFYVSALLEQGAHLRRLQDALAAAVSEKGLGE